MCWGSFRLAADPNFLEKYIVSSYSVFLISPRTCGLGETFGSHRWLPLSKVMVFPGSADVGLACFASPSVLQVFKTSEIQNEPTHIFDNLKLLSYVDLHYMAQIQTHINQLYTHTIRSKTLLTSQHII